MTAPLRAHRCGLKRVVAAATDGQLDLFGEGAPEDSLREQ